MGEKDKEKERSEKSNRQKEIGRKKKRESEI